MSEPVQSDVKETIHDESEKAILPPEQSTRAVKPKHDRPLGSNQALLKILVLHKETQKPVKGARLSLDPVTDDLEEMKLFYKVLEVQEWGKVRQIAKTSITTKEYGKKAFTDNSGRTYARLPAGISMELEVTKKDYIRCKMKIEPLHPRERREVVVELDQAFKLPLCGTITVTDEFGIPHPSESGTIVFILRSGNHGPLQIVRVIDGEWSTEIPPEVELGISDISLGGRTAVFDEDKFHIPIPENSFLPLKVRWPGETRLHVQAEDTGVELQNIELVGNLDWRKETDDHPGTYTRRNLILSDARSPIILKKERQFFGFGKKTYFARSPGYAWGCIEVDFRRGGDYVLKLNPGGELIVTVVGLDRGSCPVLRLRKASKENYLNSEDILTNNMGEIPDNIQEQIPDSLLAEFENMIDEYKEYPYAGWSPSPSYDRELKSNRPIVIDFLAEGRYLVSVEIGDSWVEPIILGKDEVKIIAGQRSNVTLSLTTAPERIKVPLKGILIMPLEWGLEEFTLSFDLLETPLGHTPEHQYFRSDELSRMEGRRDAYHWDAGDVQPGRYKIKVEPPNYITSIEVGLEGNTNAMIQVLLPAQISVRVVDAVTGIDVDVDRLHWHMKMPSGVHVWSPVSVERNPLRSRPIIISLTVDTRSSNPRTIKSNVYS